MAHDIRLQFEYSQLTTVDPVFLRLEPGTGNPITEIPPGVFEIDNTYLIGISDLDIQELPRNVTKLSVGLAWAFMRGTNVSFFWDWAVSSWSAWPQLLRGLLATRLIAMICEFRRR